MSHKKKSVSLRSHAFPLAIEMQTTSACNAGCVICPHPTATGKLPTGIMDMKLFKRIVDQIEDSPDIKIIPYLNSEPLLDPLFIERLEYLRKRCPSVHLELSTNVSPLSHGKQISMVGIHINELRLSIFGFTKGTYEKMMPGLRWNQVRRNLDCLVFNQELRASIDQLSIVMVEHKLVMKDDIRLARMYCEEHDVVFNLWGFLDRSANVKDYSNHIYRVHVFGCEQNRPAERIHITFTGEVILCCQDWSWNYRVGNVLESTIRDIWTSDLYEEHRTRIYSGTGNAPELCKRCKLSF